LELIEYISLIFVGGLSTKFIHKIDHFLFKLIVSAI
jgi:hypothetical protein